MNCIHCHQPIPEAGAGSGTHQRNHCPSCLYSRHVDQSVGDRRAVQSCGAAMEPLGVLERTTGELALLHRCVRCGKLQPNRVAGDDDAEAVLALVAARATAERIEGHYLLGSDAYLRVATGLLGKAEAAKRAAAQ